MYKTLAENLRKPLLDSRDYRLIRLSNGLTALLIHDESADRAAASLDVHVGAYKDKFYQTPGLAHFCEHLLFQGTAKYPQDNAYKAYLAQHGGRSNASTSFEHTTYMFEINSGFLEGALDRLSRFFVDPLFLETCKDREINAVDHENKKNLQLDSRRFYSLFKTTANPSHPFNYFTTGNYSTLMDLPSSRGQNVRDLLLDFYGANYSSNIMNLVVLGNEPLDELGNWVQTKFDPVRNLSLAQPSYDVPVFTAAELRKFTRAQSVRDKNQLELTFNVPVSDYDAWKYAPADYYSYLVGHESEGSIYHRLHSLGLVNSLSASPQRICENDTVFEVTCDLTAKGLVDYEQVITAVFQYLKLVTSTPPQQWVFDEMKQIRDISFKFKQKAGAFQTVQTLSRSLYRFSSYIPHDHVLDAATQIEFNPSQIEAFGSHFTTENLRIQLSSKDFDSLLEREQWYGLPYSYDDISGELLDKINNCGTSDYFHLPKHNPFIPSNFDVHGSKSETPLKTPYLSVDDNKLQLWYKRDDQFEVPKLSISLFFNLPGANRDVTSFLMTSLFCECLEDELNDVGYYASLAGLHFAASAQKCGFVLSVGGYNDKIYNLLEQIVQLVPKFSPSKEKFDIYKAKLKQRYHNHRYLPAFNQIDTEISLMINDKAYSYQERLEGLENIDHGHMDSFVKNHLWSSGVYIQSLLDGNLSKSDLHQFKNLLQKTFEDVPAIDESKEQVRQIVGLTAHIPSGTVKVDSEIPDDKNVNSCISYLIHLGGRLDHQTIARAEILSSILSEPCFHRLRTTEQLAYVVRSGIYATRSSVGYKVMVSSTKPCAYLRTRIEAFLETMDKYLVDLGEEKFNTFKEAIVSQKNQKLKNLTEEAGKLWGPIADGYYDFDKNDKLTEIIKTTSKQEIIDFFRENIHPSTSNPRVVFSLNSQRAKFKALEGILGEEFNSLIEEYQDDIPRLVSEYNAKGETKLTVDEVVKKLDELFPSGSGVDVKVDEFKTKFPKGEVPSPAEDLHKFYQPVPSL